jgi:glycine/D-amino acid oxidase-like deaminating enzyme
MRTERYDVVVAGGGAAGVAAAVGACRRGARTLLVERYGFLGGQAANANVLSYCGFYARGDACRMVVSGVGADVLAKLAALGFDVAPIRAPSGNWIVMLDPEAIKYAVDRIVTLGGVDCRLHCSLTGAHRSSERIEAVSLLDGNGRLDVEAAAFVDATGDANLGFAAGVPLIRELQPLRRCQAASFPVRFCGVAPDLVVDRSALAALMSDFKNDSDTGYVRPEGGHFVRLPGSNDLWWMGIDLISDGLDSADLGKAERTGRELAWRFLELLRARLPGFRNAHIAATGPQLGIRDSRQLQTRYRISDNDVLSGRLRDDGVALGCWPAEIHNGTGGPKFQSVSGDGTYHIPLDALHALGCDNLWVGGRVIGGDEQAYGSLRVMGTAFATGQAAGVAAAFAAEGDGAPVDQSVRRELLNQGAYF